MAGESWGGLRQFWAKNEGSSFATISAFSATDAVDLAEFTIEPADNSEDVEDEHTGSGSLQSTVAGPLGGRWTAKVNVKPVAAGTEPDYGPFLKGAFGSVSSSTYSFSDGTVLGTSLHSLQIGEYINAEWYRVISGAWVESVSFEGMDQGRPTITFSGGFTSMGFLHGAATVNGVHSSSDTTITLTADHVKKVRPGALVKFDSEDNGGSGYTVTAVDYDNEQITISPGLAGGLSGGETLAPVVPSQTLTGSFIRCMSDTCTIDSTSIGARGLKVSIDTGIREIGPESTNDRPTSIHRTSMRKVTGEVEVYSKSENAEYMGGAWNNTMRDIAYTHGSAAGKKQTFNFDNARITKTTPAPTDTGISQVTLAFTAYQNSTAADELNLVYE